MGVWEGVFEGYKEEVERNRIVIEYLSGVVVFTHLLTILTNSTTTNNAKQITRVAQMTINYAEGILHAPRTLRIANYTEGKITY